TAFPLSRCRVKLPREAHPKAATTDPLRRVRSPFFSVPLPADRRATVRRSAFVLSRWVPPPRASSEEVRAARSPVEGCLRPTRRSIGAGSAPPPDRDHRGKNDHGPRRSRLFLQPAAPGRSVWWPDRRRAFPRTRRFSTAYFRSTC